MLKLPGGLVENDEEVLEAAAQNFVKTRFVAERLVLAGQT